MAVVSHYNVQPVIDIYGAVQGRDLGGVARRHRRRSSTAAGRSCRADRRSSCAARSRPCGRRSSGLLAGLALAIVLVYLLIVVNFQSWLDPFIIITALPAALAGIVWMLFLTHTTLSVPALMGAIMCMGVATANSILVVSFAKDELARGRAALRRRARRRVHAASGPVLMTALAMIIGMVPMALGLRRRRRAERAARPRGHRRPDARDGRDAVLRAGGVRAAPPRRTATPPEIRCMTTLTPRSTDPRPRSDRGGPVARRGRAAARGGARGRVWGISTRASALTDADARDARAGGADRRGDHARARRAPAGDRRCRATCSRSPTPRSTRARTAT